MSELRNRSEAVVLLHRMQVFSGVHRRPTKGRIVRRLLVSLRYVTFLTQSCERRSRLSCGGSFILKGCV